MKLYLCVLCTAAPLLLIGANKMLENPSVKASASSPIAIALNAQNELIVEDESLHSNWLGEQLFAVGVNISKCDAGLYIADEYYKAHEKTYAYSISKQTRVAIEKGMTVAIKSACS
jgi:hypothetical protein